MHCIDARSFSTFVNPLNRNANPKALEVKLPIKRTRYTVLEASMPSEALRILDSTDRVSLMFTDVVIPKMSGCELANRARILI